jgi:hypothetical protein
MARVRFLTRILTAVSLATVSCVTSAAEPVFCAKTESDRWQIRNATMWIGAAGWTNEADCKGQLTSVHGSILCGWNGEAFQLYNIDTGAALGPEAGYGNTIDGLRGCIAHAQLQPEGNPYACAWNGRHYQPHVSATGVALGNPEHGWETAEQCVADALSVVSSYGVCAWDNGWALYLSDGTKTGIKFDTDGEQCRNFLSGILSRAPSFAKAKAAAVEIGKNRTSVPPALLGGVPSSAGFGPWKACEAAELDGRPIKNDGTHLVRECTPDTLYSWGGPEKVIWYLENLPSGKKWPGKLSRTLFTVPSAASTFGYGLYPIRVKLKPGVKARLVVDPTSYTCEGYLSDGTLNDESVKNTVVARYRKSGGQSLLEYAVCSSDVMESWSFGTPELFEEVLRDQAWMKSQPTTEWEGYFKVNGVDQFVGYVADAWMRASEGELVHRLWLNRTLATSGMGGVFYEYGPAVVDTHHMTGKVTHFHVGPQQMTAAANCGAAGAAVLPQEQMVKGLKARVEKLK